MKIFESFKSTKINELKKQNFKVGQKFKVIGNHNSSPYSVFKLNHGGYNNTTTVPIGGIITLVQDDPHYNPKVRFEYNGKTGTVEASIESMIDRKTIEILN
jgi:hypothetical protein